jgi:tubulin delta
VLCSSAESSGIWRYSSASAYTQQSGSANNWAYGYSTHAPNSVAAVSERVRKEVERCDSLGGFLLLLSLAGGTGSGVGAYVTEALRDEYPGSFLLHQV